MPGGWSAHVCRVPLLNNAICVIKDIIMYVKCCFKPHGKFHVVLYISSVVLRRLFRRYF